MSVRGLNKVQVIGNIGNDPETTQFQNGGSVTNISVATSERWTDKNTGEQKELTEWHRISFFGKLSEIASKYLKKGSQVYVEGKLRTRKWTDSNGVERYTTEIIADQMQMLGANPNSQGQTQAQATQPLNSQPYPAHHNNPEGAESNAPQSEVDEKDIPF